VNKSSKRHWTTENWPRITRLREPHQYWQRPVVDERYESDTGEDLLDPDDLVYHLGNVSPDLLRLKPGDTDSLVEFVDALGIVGLVTWAGGPRPGNLAKGFEAWEPLCIAVQDGDPTLYRPDLHAAWTHANTVERFTTEHTQLTKGWDEATAIRETADNKQAEARASLRRELVAAHFQQPYPFELVIAVTTVTDQIVERPRHILARSAFELIDALQDNLPKRCEQCNTPFARARSDQRFCRPKCQQSAFQKQHDKTPYRKAYSRMYRRYKRGNITEAEFVAWKDSAKEAKS
jgi:hypothetical protein